MLLAALKTAKERAYGVKWFSVRLRDEISNIKKKKHEPCYFINEKFMQKQPFLDQQLVLVACWLWRQYKQPKAIRFAVFRQNIRTQATD